MRYPFRFISGLTVDLHEADDATIWNYAAKHGRVIITEDADFRQRSFLLGYPPKIIWLRIGNCSTEIIASLIRNRFTEIADFIADEEKSFLGLS